jgi:hypothetical protein
MDHYIVLLRLLRLIDLIGEVSEDRPELNFNWWIPLAENRLRLEINASSGSII